MISFLRLYIFFSSAGCVNHARSNKSHSDYREKGMLSSTRVQMKAFAERTQFLALHVVVSFIDRFTTYRQRTNYNTNLVDTRGK